LYRAACVVPYRTKIEQASEKPGDA
jgi:hypothetical protein